MTQRPLEGIRVIDTSQVLAAPYAGYQLALLGADVIKVENPFEPDFVRRVGTDTELNDAWMGTQFLTQNAGKRFVALDLKQERGQKLLREMVKTADVFITNARPGAFEDIGLGYLQLSEVNPMLVHCQVSAFGARGEKRSWTGYENVVQAASGYMSTNGTPDVRPLRQGSPAIDYATGLTAAFAITSALLGRAQTGRGSTIDLAMIDVSTILMGCHITSHLRDGFEPVPSGNDMALATTSMYETLDGKIMLGACNAAQMARLWQHLGRPDVIKPDPFNSPVADFENENHILSRIMMTRTAAEWERDLQAHHIPAARVRETLQDALHDPQYGERAAFGRISVPELGTSVGVPQLGFILDEGGSPEIAPPGAVGRDTQTVLEQLGCSQDDVDWALGQLKSAGS